MVLTQKPSANFKYYLQNQWITLSIALDYSHHTNSATVYISVSSFPLITVYFLDYSLMGRGEITQNLVNEASPTLPFQPDEIAMLIFPFLRFFGTIHS